MALRVGAPLGLVVVLALATVAAIVGPRSAPAPGRETTLWMAVESVARDGDLVVTADRDRFRERFGHEPQGLLYRDFGGRKELDAPWAWTTLAAAARKLGRGGPYGLQGALLGLALVAAVATLKSRLGAVSAGLLVAVAVVGSPLFLLPFRLESFALELAACAFAAAAVWWRRSGPAQGPEQIYRGELDERPSLLRSVIAGTGFGVVLAGSPAYLPLIFPLLAAAPRERRGSAGALLALFASGVFGALFWFGGSPWEPIEPILSPSLLAWSAIGLLVGRGVGLLPYFVPLALLVANSGATGGRRGVFLAAGGALVLQLVLSPFDFVAGSLTPGNGWFLPIYALLLLSCDQAQSRAWTVATLVASSVFLAPHWMSVIGPNPVAREAAQLAAPIVDRLPIASTLRRAEGAVDLVRPELVVRAFAPAIEPAKDGKLRLSERAGTLLVVSNRPLSSLRLELGRDAPAEIGVRGGELSNTTFRPSGEVAFDVVLPKRPRRHPVWWSRDGAWIYELELRLPKRPAKPLALDLPFAKGVVPSAGEAGRP